ncbi:hypothetical protein Calab_1507 [Caldithrix abyssi DSM 13497]|uniref:Helix-turn-helix domain-containing protein n=1 Tax=Caldithrix abyssi DSM 13497 TaxID=880073 RepID=H1XTF8_CALAY|nr:helix-turn-helix domain-containing protein [Caldithrix abyssi]APF16971.1 Helix-turn-helix domain-containing protein [Caldithrix abyssi DSM 13497]APF20340.1 Helix-turn-helix domain-containing protein [Caldithrix abyssi DSM 13497]EHO40391.1 hypothetical protein Calab_0752 [Caldithrix abyssi DSM 13497]EHO41127.1 hypothetical protein Calab_1507 [Caldithrix abyssi DSM 13497]
MTQSELILKHLIRNKGITALEALRLYGCLRLSARIWELRQRGYRIDSQLIELKNGKKVARYMLKNKDKKIKG